MLPTQRAAGFTLVELITVTAVAGVLSAVALPKMADFGGAARMAKIESARGAVIESARNYHLKWLLDGSSGAGVIDGVEMGAAGFPTQAGILVAAGVADSYDTRVAGIIATDPQHPDCSLSYAPATGSAALNAVDGKGC